MNDQLQFRFEDEDPDHIVYLTGKYKEILEQIQGLPLNKWLVINNIPMSSLQASLSTSNLSRVLMHQGFRLIFKSLHSKERKELWIRKVDKDEFSNYISLKTKEGIKAKKNKNIK